MAGEGKKGLKRITVNDTVFERATEDNAAAILWNICHMELAFIHGMI
jgi:hypothetical protein